MAEIKKKQGAIYKKQDDEKKKGAYDYAVVSDFANKVKSKMRFSMEITTENGKNITKKEEEALLFGFNYAISACGVAINEVLKEYELKKGK